MGREGRMGIFEMKDREREREAKGKGRRKICRGIEELKRRRGSIVGEGRDLEQGEDRWEGEEGGAKEVYKWRGIKGRWSRERQKGVIRLMESRSMGSEGFSGEEG